MKSPSGFMELVIIMVFMAACTPLLVTLVITGNSSQMEYLSDKTTTTVVDSIEYTTTTVNGRKVLVPTSMAPISIDFGGAIAMAVVQDDYCPDDGRTVVYAWDLSSVLGTVNSDAGVLNIVTGWRGLKVTKWQSALTKCLIAPDGNYAYSKYGSRDASLVWSATRHCWVIASPGTMINIFETR